MRHLLGRGLLVVLAGTFLACIAAGGIAHATPAAGTSYTVNCAAGQTIGPVLDLVSLGTTPVTIKVKGFCNENVSIVRDDVTLVAATTNAGIRRLTLTDARRIELRGLRFGVGGVRTDASVFHAFGIQVTGAPNGLWLDGGSVGYVEQGKIAKSKNFGVIVLDSSAVFLINSSITGNLKHGVYAISGSHAHLDNVRVAGNHEDGVLALAAFADVQRSTIENNTNVGVHTMHGGEANINEGTTVRGNGNWGVTATAADVSVQGSFVRTNVKGGVIGTSGGRVALSNGSIVERNHGDGVRLENGSSLMTDPGTVVIRRNSGDGVSLGDTSTASIAAPVQIVGNSGWGIACEASPSTAVIRGFAGGLGTVSGNAAGQNGCDVAP